MDIFAIGMELLTGIGLFFLHPLFYIFLFFSVFLGYKRVQRERRDFHIRVYDVVDDVLRPLFPSLLGSLIISSLLIATGIVLPSGVIVLFALVQSLFLITGQARLLSFAYTGGVTLFIALAIPEFTTGTVIIDRWLSEIHSVSLSSLALLISFFLLAEGVLIIKNGAQQTSPKLLKSKRGKMIGAHEVQRVWIIPTLLLLPNGVITATNYWPVVPTDLSQFGLIVIPFAIGFGQLIRSRLPKEAIIVLGKRVLLLGFIVLSLSVVSVFVSYVLPLAVLTAFLGRITIDLLLKQREDKQVNFYTEREHGLVVLGVIPQSPGAKLAIKIGEIVIKVNGIPVSTTQEFYEALRLNSAFCKLEIIDENGEIRIVQTALYDGEHHQIGLLFVEQQRSFVDQVM